VLDDSLRRGILDGLDSTALHARAVSGGMSSLYEDGVRKVAAGITSMEELLRVTEDSVDA